ncbi:Uncharacterised protein [Mycobacteroides abscessus subsp. abscessus]|nr:Uncharacterised protein [Mycobacteroides abscessus subsp. abscessus]
MALPKPRRPPVTTAVAPLTVVVVATSVSLSLGVSTDELDPKYVWTGIRQMTVYRYATVI